MVLMLGIIAVLLGVMMLYLKRFMTDMAAVESQIIQELKEMKALLAKLGQK
ncbi:MAG: hypothetical protein WCG06_02430 [Candidatus Omnitrophota bacterium]